MKSCQVSIFLYLLVENAQFCTNLINHPDCSTSILNFPKSRKNVNSLERLRHIPENSSTQWFSLRNKRKLISFSRRILHIYTQRLLIQNKINRPMSSLFNVSFPNRALPLLESVPCILTFKLPINESQKCQVGVHVLTYVNWWSPNTALPKMFWFLPLEFPANKYY